MNLTAAGALNHIAGTRGLSETAAANAAANTERLTLAGALNALAGTQGLTETAAANAAAGTQNLTLVGALNVLASGPLLTVEEMLEQDTFFIAHRGGGDNNPEHTMLSYEYGAAFTQAIEVSVARTSDGVFICHHDLTTERMTGVNHTISATAWSTLQALETDARQQLGPNTPLVPITPLEDVLNRFGGRVVIFIEDKQGTNTTALLDLMDTVPHSTETMVWKTYRDGGAAAASARGYKVWGYLDDDDPNLETVSAAVDMLGVSVTGSDAWIQEVVAEGKPTISWEIHRRHERDRVLGLGVQGLMSSNLPYVMHDQPMSTSDAFATGRRPSGDLPYQVSQWAWQPSWTLVDDEYVIDLDYTFGQPYSLGSICPTPENSYVIEAELRFPNLVPFSSSHVGIAFGRSSDARYRFNTEMPVGGYHMIFRGNGDFQLYRHDPNQAAGTQLASTSTPAPVVGAWIPFRITVIPSGIACRRLDTDTQISTSNTQYRGHYVHLSRNYDGADRHVQFRNVRWES